MKKLEDYLYYHEPGPPDIKIYHGDCNDILPLIDGVELVLTDPPYNAKNIGPNHREYSEGPMQLPEKEYIKFCNAWFSNVKATRTVFTPGIANMCYYPQPSWAFCWHKPAAVSFNRFGGFNAWEPIFAYGKVPKGKRFGQDYLLFNTLNFSKGAEKGHPCPKPLALWKFLLDGFSLNNVLDPFLGSGTTLVACKELKRNGIGIEINEKYCEIAKKRLQNTIVPFI